MIGSGRSEVRRANAVARRRWLALLLLALLANLSASAATHRHPAHSAASTALQQASAPAPQAPASPAGSVSLDDVCAICAALAGSASVGTSRVSLDLRGRLAGSFGALPDLTLWAAQAWWIATASRAPPRFLF